eukprot:349391-Lingulodinium_polyedra.AAC.1
MMFYRGQNKMAIRRTKFPKKQLFQFGTHSMTRKRMVEIASDAIKRLERGDAEASVKSWAQHAS